MAVDDDHLPSNTEQRRLDLGDQRHEIVPLAEGRQDDGELRRRQRGLPQVRAADASMDAKDDIVVRHLMLRASGATREPVQ